MKSANLLTLLDVQCCGLKQNHMAWWQKLIHLWREAFKKQYSKPFYITVLLPTDKMCFHVSWKFWKSHKKEIHILRSFLTNSYICYSPEHRLIWWYLFDTNSKHEHFQQKIAFRCVFRKLFSFPRNENDDSLALDSTKNYFSFLP